MDPKVPDSRHQERVQEGGWINGFSTEWNVIQRRVSALVRCCSGGIGSITIYVSESSKTKGPSVPSPGTGEDGRKTWEKPTEFSHPKGLVEVSTVRRQSRELSCVSARQQDSP